MSSESFFLNRHPTPRQRQRAREAQGGVKCGIGEVGLHFAPYEVLFGVVAIKQRPRAVLTFKNIFLIEIHECKTEECKCDDCG